MDGEKGEGTHIRPVKLHGAHIDRPSTNMPAYEPPPAPVTAREMPKQQPPRGTIRPVGQKPGDPAPAPPAALDLKALLDQTMRQIDANTQAQREAGFQIRGARRRRHGANS